jgi:hypothetical protein
MWPTPRTLWLSLLCKSPRRGSLRRRAHARRPFLEVLEDRSVPASLGYSTLLQGTVYATAVDSSGNVCVTGQAGSGFSPTPGAYDTNGSVGGAFVAKLSPTGNVIYATYLGSGGGGINYPAGTGIAVDAAGDAYVIGEGASVATTANAIAATDPSGVEDFVAELNPTGSALVYATYLPGTINSPNYTMGYAGAIALDGSGNIYVAGYAASGLPVTAGAFQTSGNGAGFFMKINPGLSGTASVLYGSYLSALQINAVAVDGAGNAYVEGFDGPGLPTTSGAYQTTCDTYSSCFVAKFDPSLFGAASLVYCTYLGGSAVSGGFTNNGEFLVVPQTMGGIAVDNAGNVYVTDAAQANFATTPGAFQTTYNNDTRGGIGAIAYSDAFVVKLNATGSALVYSTYLGGGTIGGSGTASGGAGITVDANGDAYVTGWTNSTTFPTVNPVQATNSSGNFDSFVTELNPAGSGLLFSTYLGGSSGAYGYGIALDSAGNVYDAGATSAGYNNIPVSGFAAKITGVNPAGSLSVSGFPSTTTAGVSQAITVTALNANGTVNTGYTGTVHFSSSDPQAVLPANYTFTAADQGVYTFPVTLETAGTQSITVADTSSGILGSESGITVNPAAASTLRVAGYPSPANAGLAGNFTVTALDPYGNVATGYAGTVRFSSSDPSAALPANYTFTAADAGVHNFSATLNTTGTQSLTATDTATGSITGAQANITVDPAGLPAATLRVTGFPSSATAGTVETITVTARDSNGNIAPSYHGTVHFSSSDPEAVLPANYTFSNADQGVHTFTVTLKTAGSQSITATDTTTGSITGSESSITITPAAAAQFILSAPSSVSRGSKFSVTLTVEDAYGNVVTGYTGTVHFTSSDSTATLPANYTFTAANSGVHTFTGLVLRKKGTQILTVTDTQNSALTGNDSINVT